MPTRCARASPPTRQIARELGWHLDLLLPGWLISELMPTLRALPVEFTVAHMGLFPAADGVKQPGFQEFLALVADGSKRCWVKLTGIYRFSKDPDFADVAPFAQALIATAPDQLIWGSDYPHLSFHDKVGTIGLYNKLAEWADAGERAAHPRRQPGAAVRIRVKRDGVPLAMPRQDRRPCRHRRHSRHWLPPVAAAPGARCSPTCCSAPMSGSARSPMISAGALGWMMLSTLLIWAAPAQIILISTLGPRRWSRSRSP